MELILFGVGSVALILTWIYMWLPLKLDEARDALFDLRDDRVREYFLSNNLGLDHPLYIALRDLINGHLKNTQSLTISRFVGTMVASRNAEETRNHILKKIEKRFSTDDVELKRFVDEVRMQAIMIMLDYMIATSALVVFLGFITVFVNFVFALFQYIIKLVRGIDGATNLAIERLSAAVFDLAKLIRIGSKRTAQSTMEECALAL